MQARWIATLANGVLVQALYLVAWGTPTVAVAVFEVALATGAAVSTWYALKSIRAPKLMMRLALGVQGLNT